MTVKPIYQFPHARVIDDPATEGRLIIVQRQDAHGSWVDVCRYDRLSDDYAFTRARDEAERLSKKHAAAAAG